MYTPAFRTGDGVNSIEASVDSDLGVRFYLPGSKTLLINVKEARRLSDWLTNAVIDLEAP